MAIPGANPLRVLRRERYALAVAAGTMTLKDAYAAAGYKGSPSGNNPTMLARQTDVAARIEYLRKRTAEKVVETAAVTRGSILQSLMDRRDRAMRGAPILNRDGSLTGEFKEDFAAGNRCDELLGKAIGMYIDVQAEENLDEALKGKDINELREQLVSDIHELDPNLHKQVTPGEAEADDDDSDASPVERLTLQ